MKTEKVTVTLDLTDAEKIEDTEKEEKPKLKKA